MKKMIFALVMLLTASVSASAMSYEQARNEALFLTDKMAYELNLTDAQYEAAYEINLDYLMGVTGVDDVFGVYWERRNLDLSYILYSWQWDAFRAASYFYRPLYWDAGFWHFGVYTRYPRRDYFYFGRPHFYATYRGGHAWHLHGSLGYYHGHATHFRPSLPQGRTHFGMRNGYDRGDYRGSRNYSSTRYNGGRDGYNGGRDGYNGGRDRSDYGRYNRSNERSTYGGSQGNRRYDNSSSLGRSSVERSTSGNFSRSSRSAESLGRSSSGRSTYGGSQNSNFNRSSSQSGSFSRSSSQSGSFSRSTPTRSIGGGGGVSHSSTRSVGGGSFSNGNSSSSSNGGGHFGKAHR